MKDYITFTNPETNERIDIDITDSQSKEELLSKLKELPKSESGKWAFGNILIHVWGGGAILSK